MSGFDQENLFGELHAQVARSQPKTPDQLVEGLTAPQRASVEHRGGPLLIVAGAGSGKTRVLTRRIAHLLATGDAAPHEILAITFTNKAANEMVERLVDLVGERARRMWVMTFHKAFFRMLQSEADRLGYRSRLTLYDDTDSRRLIQEILRERDIDPKKVTPKGVSGRISLAKATLQSPAEYAEGNGSYQGSFHQISAEVYAEYERRLFAASAVDFDDLLLKPVELFRRHEDVRLAYADRFRHVLVDEFQDTNRAQNELVFQLTRDHRQVCVVGDSDQSIYRFRAADIRNILDFESTFPDAEVVVLEQNFRSTQRILDAANAVISNNAGRVVKNLFTEVGQGNPITVYGAMDERDEAAWVAAEVIRLSREQSLGFDDIAIFYRTNAQSRVLEEEFNRAGIPHRLVGATRFYDRREIRDLLAYVRLLVNPDDEMSARRIVNVPKRGIGATSV
ncbi:MAG: UvrD-helicase domain-containing protein, partial [Actinomycetota bacterium]